MSFFFSKILYKYIHCSDFISFWGDNEKLQFYYHVSYSCTVRREEERRREKIVQKKVFSMYLNLLC